MVVDNAGAKRGLCFQLCGLAFYCLISVLFLPEGTRAFSHSSSLLQRTETVFASTSKAKDETATSTNAKCQFCGETFGTRNALFRHLKTSESCSAEFRSLGDRENGEHEEGSVQNTMSRLSLLLKISYFIENGKNNTATSVDVSSTVDFESASNCFGGAETNASDAREIGQKVQEAIESSLWDIIIFRNSTAHSRHQSRDGRMVVSATQTSVANNRPSVLAQENGISSAEDFLLLNLQFPGLDEEVDIHEISNLLDGARNHLGGDINTSSGSIYDVRILSGMRLPKKFNFHAEQDCTQRVYHYLLPLSWLPDGSMLQSWCEQYVDKPKPSPPTDALARLREALQLAESTAVPNRKVRRRQKHRQERSKDNKSASDSRVETSAQKFRKTSAAFVRKERKPWHNFGHKDLRGDASPNQQSVWNVLDKARIKGFLLPSDFSDSSPAGEALAVLEFRGDNFLPGQIQSIVGTAVAVTNGWLPPKVFPMALSEDFLLEIPTATKNRLYCAGARYHSHESKLIAAAEQNSGMDRTIFATSKKAPQGSEELQYGRPKTPLQTLQEQVLKRVYSAEESILVKEKQWLEDLERKVSPTIRKEMERLQRVLDGNPRHADASADNLPSLEARVHVNRWVDGGVHEDGNGATTLLHAYNKTLHLLREAISSGSWPETSAARSNVLIRAEKGSSSREKMESSPASLATQTRGPGGGSFTVFNPQIEDNPLLASIGTISSDGIGGNSEAVDWLQPSLPLGNQRFPDLLEAVFDLERELNASRMLRQRANVDGSLCEMNEESTRKHVRPASFCCAINANASFKPHVDSGRGSGQSLSLIVGLGDYEGGEIRVEDHSHDIRYKPLEFDGWSSRHWTQPYRGERFSLVWFSPAMPTTKG